MLKYVKWVTIALAIITMVTILQSTTASGTVMQVQTTYSAKCALCHAADGSGNTPKGKELKMKDLRSPEVQKMTDAEMYKVIAKGKKKMPGYEASLGKQACNELVAYMRELAKKK